MSSKQPIRIAVAIDMEWPLKRHHDAVAGVLKYARQQEAWTCVLEPWIGSSPESKDPAEHYDGVVGRISGALGRYAEARHFPVVNIWVNSPARSTPAVFPDIHAISLMSAKHLMSRGFNRFAFIGAEGSRPSNIKYQGLLNLTGQPAERVPRILIPAILNDAQGWQAMQSSVRAFVQKLKPPVGILAADDLIGRYLVDVCLNANLRVPDDVAVVGTGNDLLICDALEPTLSSIDAGYERIGYRAAALLDRLIQGEPAPAEPLLVDPVELIPRRSTDVFAVDDRSVAEALRFIWDHHAQRIGVDDIVADLPMTRRTLERRFRDVLGRTIHEEIMRSKIEHAKRRLIETKDSIQRIARDCGFSSQAHMSKVFRRFENSAPSEFRKRQTEDGSTSSSSAS
ncbi:MAG: substrate-binding domain-containing protein [Phycisphaeraceae bacterium]|nr:substrate-binding domain-containing protein [Phycisphaeraceae bacterium]